MPVNLFDTLLALDNNLNGGNPRNGFVSQRVIDKVAFVYEDSHTTGEWNMLSNREHFLASKAAVRNASVSPPQLSHRVAVRRKRQFLQRVTDSQRTGLGTRTKTVKSQE